MSYSEYIENHAMDRAELPLVHITEYFWLSSIQARRIASRSQTDSAWIVATDDGFGAIVFRQTKTGSMMRMNALQMVLVN